MMKGSDIPTLFGLDPAGTDNLSQICDYIRDKTEHLGDVEIGKLFSRYAFKITSDKWSVIFTFRRIDGSVIAVTTSKPDDWERIEDVDVLLHM